LLDAPLPLRVWHLTSLDAPTVAVVWALGFSWIVEVHLPCWLLFVLALVVWVIYVADRLLDAQAGELSGRLDRLRDRHRFHWAHRRILAPMAVVATACAAVMVLTLMPAVARERNTVLAAAALAYFTRVHSTGGLKLGAARLLDLSAFQFPLKELAVGLLFAAGCALPAWNRAGNDAWKVGLPVLFFAGLACLNCRAIECWEGRPRSIRLCAGVLSVVGLILVVCLYPAQPRPAGLLLAGAASAMLIALLDWRRRKMTPLALRVAADLVLLTPLALLWR
jgi:hypothetical protein